MATLDSCISSVFEPGNPGLATDTGTVTTPSFSGFLLLEDPTEHSELAATDDATDWMFTPAGGHYTSTVTGTWTGLIVLDYGEKDATGTVNYVSTDPAITIIINGSGFGPAGPAWWRLRMATHGSGTAIFDAHPEFDCYFLIEEAGAVIGRLKLES